MAIEEFVHFGFCRVLIMLHIHCSVECSDLTVCLCQAAKVKVVYL